MWTWGWALCGGLAAASVARADVTGSYDGGLTPKKATESIAAAAVFSEVDRLVSGTVALPPEVIGFGGAYLVNGKASPKRVKVSGVGPGGAQLKFRGQIVGETIQGKAKLATSTGKLKGVLVFTRNASGGDGSTCDGVYTANETFFTDQVLGQALASCDTCHGAGLQAGATRLHVNAADPLGTARQIALLVDSENPPASRILEKPLNLLPHGGGAQLVVGSPEEQILTQWTELIAVAACN
jgi:hypothetical protein